MLPNQTGRTPAKRRTQFAAESDRKPFLSPDAWDRVLQIISPVVVLLVWEALVRLNLMDGRFFPKPSSLVDTFLKLTSSGELLRHIAASMLRVFGGFVMGGVPGLVLGMMMGLSRWVRSALQPLVAAFYPIPKIAILPLIILIFGLGEMSKIVIVAIAVFFLVLYNTMAGVMNIPKIYMEVGTSFGASRLFYYRTIALPGALPFIFTGFKLAMGVAMLVLVSAEFVGAKSGLGYMIWDAWQTFSVPRLFVGLFATSILGYMMSELLDLLQRWLVPWRY